MKRKILGKTNEYIAAIGQGCRGIGGYFAQDSSDEKHQIVCLQKGIELGMTFIDTAEDYGAGHSEEIVGKAIQGIRDTVFVATKVSAKHLRFNDVVKAAEQSLKRLQTDYIDLYQIHWPNPVVALEQTARALIQLGEQGKIRFAGVSNFSLRRLREIEGLLSPDFFVSTQEEYGPCDRTIEKDVLLYCQNRGITMIAYSPFGQGKKLSKKADSAVKDLASTYGKTPAQIILNWVIGHSGVVVVSKSTNSRHLEENGSALDFDLETKDSELLNDLFGQRLMNVPTQCIRVVGDGGKERRDIYETLQEAIENRFDFIPSPVDLARDLIQEKTIKPVCLVPIPNPFDSYEYDLIEGRNRYWAWVIAHDAKVPIPAYIYSDEGGS